MNAPQARRIRDLENTVRHLQQALAQRPRVLSIGAAAASLSALANLTGNTLTTGQSGIKNVSGTITDVASAYDPNIVTSYPDGIGRADMWTNGVFVGKVLIINDSAANPTGVRFAVLSSDIAVPSAAVTLTVGGDPNTTVTAYRMLFI